MRRYAVDDEERRTIGVSVKMKATPYKELLSIAKKDGRSMTWLIEKALMAHYKLTRT